MKKEETVKLISAEGFEFIIDKKAAMVSQTIRNMLTSPGNFAEAALGEVTFPEISGVILEKICQYFHWSLQYARVPVVHEVLDDRLDPSLVVLFVARALFNSLFQKGKCQDQHQSERHPDYHLRSQASPRGGNDRITEEESALKINIPKLNKGIRGTSIKEVKEELPATEAGPEGSDDANPMATSPWEDDSKEHEIKKDAATVKGNDPEEEAPQAKIKQSERGGTADTEKPPSKNLKTREAETAGDNTRAGIGGRESQTTEDYIEEAKEENEKQE
ncbi:Elongin-C-like protein [Drosera capensis]